MGPKFYCYTNREKTDHTSFGHKFRILPVNNDVARIQLIDPSTNIAMDIPLNIQMVDKAGIVNEPLRNEWFVTWFDEYTITEGQNCLMVLRNEKKQSVGI